MTSRLTWIIAGAASLVCATAAAGPAPWRAAPNAGVRSYRYEAHELNGGSMHGFRLDYRLRVDDKGGAIAEVLHAWTLDGMTFTPVTVDAACAKTIDAPPGVLAAVRLAPLTPERAKLGDAFLPTCAPSAIFLPLTDILNVHLIQSSDQFHVGDLKSTGQSAQFPGFSTSIDRPGMAMAETVSSGTIKLLLLHGGVAALDWKPEPAKLDLTETASGGQPVKLTGTEHFAFQLIVDSDTGWLAHGDTLYDDLDMAVALPNAPADKAPHVTITRKVSIIPLPE